MHIRQSTDLGIDEWVQLTPTSHKTRMKGRQSCVSCSTCDDEPMVNCDGVHCMYESNVYERPLIDEVVVTNIVS